MDYLILFYFLISTIPGVYLATKKYFFVIPNEKYNIFFVRLIFSVPALTIFVLLLSLIPLLFEVFLEDFSNYLIGYFGRYIILGMPALASLITILFFEMFCLRKDMPFEFQNDFMNHELYVFMPEQRIVGGNYYKTKFTYPKKRESKELLVGIQAEDLILDLKILEKYDVAYTHNGEIVVGKNALDIFSLNNLSGYYTKHIKDHRNPLFVSDNKKFQIFSQCNLPKMALKTKICHTRVPWLAICVHNDLIYYDKKILNNVSDFNRSFEVFGSHDGFPYAPQHLWIVTNKAMKVLINELNQQKRDFIPVNLVDDEKNNISSINNSK
jgi:hypothetical protein